jgi:hypothetical protein
MTRTTLTFALLSAACGSTAGAVQTDESPGVTSRGVIVPAASASEVSESEEVEEVGATEAPADVDALLGTLGAHHVAHLPDAETLHAYPSGEESLRWVAVHGNSMVLRVRALSLLRHFTTPTSREFALSQLDDATPQLYAAAVTALSGQDLEADGEAREAIEAALRVDDVRVGLAAITALSNSPAGREALGRACEDDSVPERIREAVMELLASMDAQGP